LLALVLGVALWVFLSGLTNPMVFESLAKAVPGMRINVIMMGLDAPHDRYGRAIPDFDIHKAVGSRTDTMMLVSIDPQTKDVAVISLPRDTRVIIAGREDRGYDKLGHAHAYGRRPGDGTNMLIGTVSKLLDIPIHYYVRVNSLGAERIIDLLGGVEIYVEKDMYYHDPYQSLTIDLKAGLQVLNGHDSVGYLKYRSDGGDILRIERQQKFLKALRDRLFRAGIITRIPALLTQLAENVDTNMTAVEMIQYAKLATQMDMPNLRTEMLPGTDIWVNGVSYWEVDRDACAVMVDECLWGVNREANATISVAVLNGTQVSGLAARFASELERQGYNVILVADADRKDFPTTEILERTGDTEKLHHLSRAVLRYLPDAELGHLKPSEGQPDFTVIIGEDYAAYIASREEALGG